MTPHLQHPSRASHRPLKVGDRIRRRPSASPASGPNYPGANLFGTVTEVHSNGWTVAVSVDDGHRDNVIAAQLTRL